MKADGTINSHYITGSERVKMVISWQLFLENSLGGDVELLHKVLQFPRQLPKMLIHGAPLNARLC